LFTYNHSITFCEAGCTAASDRYFNMFIDVQDHVNCKDFVESEESWYLDNLNKRNNAKILYMVAKEFSLEIPTIIDPHAYTEMDKMADCCTESLTHSLYRDSQSQVITVTNCCMDTRCSRNGVLCSIQPTQGMCLFKGAVATNQAEFVYGGPFGHDSINGPSCFPTSFPPVSSNYSFTCKPPTGSPMQNSKMPTTHFVDTSVLARLDAKGMRIATQNTQVITL